MADELAEIGVTRRWPSINVTYYAHEETVTKRTKVWEHYEAKCVGGKTPDEALERLLAGEGARITGKRRFAAPLTASTRLAGED